MSTARAITFDAAGTLMRPWPSVGSVYAAAVRGRGYAVEDGEVNERFYCVFSETQSAKSAFEGDERGFWRMIVGRTFEGFCPKEIHDSLFEELWETFAEGKCWRLAEGAVDTLQVLGTRGYRLAVLSNNDSRLRPVLRDLGVSDLFEELFISSEIGFEKPSPEIFQEVERVLGTTPKEMFHLGDSYSRDMQGAFSAGWRTSLYSEKECKLPDDVSRIERFRELLDLLP
jgi:putative hydrolase of the HAD superfamily